MVNDFFRIDTYFPEREGARRPPANETPAITRVLDGELVINWHVVAYNDKSYGCGTPARRDALFALERQNDAVNKAYSENADRFRYSVQKGRFSFRAKSAMLVPLANLDNPRTYNLQRALHPKAKEEEFEGIFMIDDDFVGRISQTTVVV